MAVFRSPNSQRVRLNHYKNCAPPHPIRENHFRYKNAISGLVCASVIFLTAKKVY